MTFRWRALCLLLGLTRTSFADECLDASQEARGLVAQRKLLEARSKLRICAASTCDSSVNQICAERLAEVNDHLASIIFDVKDDAGNDIANVHVSIDAEDRPDPIGSEITLDPGPHTFVFSTDLAPPLTRRIVLAEREKARRERIVIGRPPTPEPTRQPLPSASVPPAPRSTSSVWPTIGWTTIAGGAFGMGLGAAFGIQAIERNSTADCDAHNVCADPRSRHDARSSATVSTTAFVAGGVLIATGMVFLLLPPRLARQVQAVVTSTVRW